ncbi:hypothetical protein F4555_001092 [Mobiluncus mulieris]|nr:hypothetical protein [Mobiluncus mulieris]
MPVILASFSPDFIPRLSSRMAPHEPATPSENNRIGY